MKSDLTRTKAQLRESARARLATVSLSHRTAESSRICARLKGSDLWNSLRTILFFAPLPDEPDLWPLVEFALRDRKLVALPCYDAKSEGYSARLLGDLGVDLQIGRFGVREPKPQCEEMALNRLDLVLVPGVAFDAHGRRLGRGKGFYDRLLAGVGGTKCGIAFDEQIVGEVPAGPQDVQLNCILTPTRWIET